MSSTVADPGQTQRTPQRGTDKPSSGYMPFNFNPLHPSMELPPEHLIRLLGLGNKTKRRKKRPAPTPARREEKKPESAKPGDTSAGIRQDRKPRIPVIAKPRRNLLLTSLITGVIAGLSLSVYLFWSSPGDTPPTPAQIAPLPKADNTTVPAPGVIKQESPTVTSTAIPAETNRRDTVKPASGISPAKIEAEEKRLRGEAEKRFAQRRLQQDTRSDPEPAFSAGPATSPATLKTGPAEPEVTPENFVGETTGETLF